MLHWHGFSDLDFCLLCTSSNRRVCSVRHKAVTLLGHAVRSLTQVASRTLLLHKGKMLSLMLELSNGGTCQIQFVLHVFQSISEILMSCDFDATQVIYRGANDSHQGLYMSPLALEAYSLGFITIRSRPGASSERRIARYAFRGFGVCVDFAMMNPEDFNDFRRFHKNLRWLHLCRPESAMLGRLEESDMICKDFNKHVLHFEHVVNHILAHRSNTCRHGCVPIVVQHPNWQLCAFALDEHLPHIEFKNRKSTQNFILKHDKCSLPSLRSDHKTSRCH